MQFATKAAGLLNLRLWSLMLGVSLAGLFAFSGPAWCAGGSDGLDGALPDPNIEIAIVGGGPAGLVAADKLKSKGYKNVTILEADAKVGGKVLSHEHGGKVYELGAVVSSPDYDRDFAIAKEVGVELMDTLPRMEIRPGGAQVDYWQRVKDSGGMLKIGWSFNTFRKFIIANPQVFEPGFAKLPTELLNTYETAAKVLGFAAISDLYRPPMVGCGYGYLESMPAPYIIKLMKTFAHDNFRYTLNPLNRTDFFRQFKGGWQNLWQRFAQARGFNILTNAPVRRMTRTMGPTGKPSALVTYGATQGEIKTKRFDRVIVTVPHLIDRMMELNAEEEEVFSHVETIPYKVTLLEIDNLPRGHHLWIREHATRTDSEGLPNDGKVVLLSNPYAENNLYIAYQFTERDKTSEQLRKILLANATQAGGAPGKILVERTFDYFPHFSVEGFRAGAHTRFEALQGQGGIYYTGALANFETVKFAGDHAAFLVDKYF